MADLKRAGPDDLSLLVEAHTPGLFRLAFRLTGNRPDAEDLVQDTFVRALPRLRTVAGNGASWPYLHRILVRLAIDRSRRRQVLPFDWDVEDPSPGPHDDVVANERRRRLRAALAALPPPERMVLVLLHAEGWSVSDTASALGLPATVVKNRAYRARRRLRRVLSAYEEREEDARDDRP